MKRYSQIRRAIKELIYLAFGVRRSDYVHLGARVKSTLYDSEVLGLRVLRGVGQGKRCFIMGNGPSLKAIDPGPLAGEVTFGSNAIYLVKDWLGFLPTYHVTEDILVIEDRGKEISQLVGPKKFYSKRFVEKVPPNGDVVHPNIIYDYSEYRDFPAFSRNAAKRMWCGGTVSYLCLQLAYYMEYDPVILVGFDHHYVKPSHITADGVVWTSHGDDPNHIHPEYFGKGRRWHDPRVDRMERAYMRARYEFERVGRKVVNATVGGRLEVFPRVDYFKIIPGAVRPANSGSSSQ